MRSGCTATVVDHEETQREKIGPAVHWYLERLQTPGKGQRKSILLPIGFSGIARDEKVMKMYFGTEEDVKTTGHQLA